MHDLTIRPVENAPRVLDTDLAEMLGYERPRKIRELIRRNVKPLAEFGDLPHMGQKSSDPLGRGRPAKAYLLNQDQAIYLTAKSDTPIAAAMTVHVVKKFRAYERGEIISEAATLPGASPLTVPSTDIIAALETARDLALAGKVDAEHRLQVTQRALEAAQPLTVREYADEQGISLARSESSRIGYAATEMMRNRESLPMRRLTRSGRYPVINLYPRAVLTDAFAQHLTGA